MRLSISKTAGRELLMIQEKLLENYLETKHDAI